MRILWLKTGLLHPLDSGGKIRTFNMLRVLRQRHHVTYLALCPDDADTAELRDLASEYSTDQVWVPWRETPKGSAAFYLELLRNLLLSRRPYVIDKYTCAPMVQALRQADTEGHYDLVVCDFLSLAANVMELESTRRTPAVLFQHNVEALIWQRLADAAGNSAKRRYLRSQWQRMAAFEQQASKAFEGVITVSPEDRDLMARDYGLNNVLGDVPTGVDPPYFAGLEGPKQPASLLFLGSMDWMPNIDALDYFVAEVYDRIKARVPDVSLTVVGRRPVGSVTRLAEVDRSIHVTGTVPDVRPYLAAAEVLVVPLRVGGGTRIKIFEGMAAGLPVVSTHIGAEGLPLEHGRHLMLADTAEAFAEATVTLLLDADRRRRLASAGQQLVCKRYSWQAVTDKFEALCQSVVAGNPGLGR